MSTPEASVQLYTVREALDADFGGTLERLAGMGLRNAEAFAFTGRAAEYRSALDAAGLKAPSGHANFLSDELRFGDTVIEIPPFESVLDDAAAVGVRMLIDPLVPLERWESIEEIGKTADRMNALVDLAESRGISLGYHNHSQEFHHEFDGVSALEAFASRLDPRVVLEVDVFWAALGGQDVPALLGRLGDRVRMLHVKDGVLGGDPFAMAEPDFEVLDQRVAGTGELPLHEILRAAPAAQYAVIEFDRIDGDVVDAVQQSVAFLAAEGIR